MNHFQKNLQTTKTIIAMLPFVRETLTVCLELQQYNMCLRHAESRSGLSTKG